MFSKLDLIVPQNICHGGYIHIHALYKLTGTGLIGVNIEMWRYRHEKQVDRYTVHHWPRRFIYDMKRGHPLAEIVRCYRISAVAAAATTTVVAYVLQYCNISSCLCAPFRSNLARYQGIIYVAYVSNTTIVKGTSHRVRQASITPIITTTNGTVRHQRLSPFRPVSAPECMMIDGYCVEYSTYTGLQATASDRWREGACGSR